MATLTSLVDETSNIKNELVECHTNLYETLNNYGVEVLSEDKLGDLINKVNDANFISIKEPVIAGDDVNVFADTALYAHGATVTFSDIKYNGSYRVKFIGGSMNEVTSTYQVSHMRGSSTIKTEKASFSQYTGYRSFSYDFSDVKKGDSFVFNVNTGGSHGSYLKMTNIYISIKCDI